jgi:hypothetical protein
MTVSIVIPASQATLKITGAEYCERVRRFTTAGPGSLGSPGPSGLRFHQPN